MAPIAGALCPQTPKPIRVADSFCFKKFVKHGVCLTGAAAVAGGTLARSAPGNTLPRSASSRNSSNNRTPQPTLTQGLIGLNALIFGAQVLSKDLLTLWGVKVNQLIVAGQWWRLITPAFLHGNLMHLAVNCYSLYSLAPLVETLSGGKRLLAVYFGAALAGNIASFYGSTAPSLGASGAVFGVGGALAMYFWVNKGIYGKRADYVLKQLWQTLLINLFYGLANPRIDNWGHMGGLAGGALVAYLLGPKLKLGSLPGQRGQFLFDRPPLPLLASPPRQVK